MKSRRPIVSHIDQCKSSRVLHSGCLVSWVFRFLISKLNCLPLLGKCHLRGCLVRRRLKCEKQKTQLHEPSRSTAQWTMETLSVDAKDSGRNPSHSRIRQNAPGYEAAFETCALFCCCFFFGQTSCDLVSWLRKKFQFQELWNFWVIIREEKTNHSEAQCQSARLARRGSLHGLFQEFRWWRVSDEQPPHNIMNDDSYYHSCGVGMSAQSEKRIGLDDEPSISAAKQLDSPKRKCQRNQQRCENIFLILQ